MTRDAAVSVDAPAKINLYLHVLGKRADGYHLLDSLIAFADIGDTVTVRAGEMLALDCDGPFADALANEADNLVLKAARLLADRAGIAASAHLRLTKRLPVASGIGGGSADAAATLTALAKLWNLSLPARAMDAIALELGADVPVCLHGRAAYIGGVGERIDAAPKLPAAGIVLANPGIALSTPAVFKSFAGPMGTTGRFYSAPTDAAGFGALLALRRNDLTEAAIARVPDIAAVLTALGASPGQRLARMSGSGATCFALYDDRAAAEGAATALAAENPGWWVRAGALIG